VISDTRSLMYDVVVSYDGLGKPLRAGMRMRGGMD
jgi:hypothetical protein